MARLLYFLFIPAIMTAVFGYPSTVPSIQDAPSPDHLTHGAVPSETKNGEEMESVVSLPGEVTKAKLQNKGLRSAQQAQVGPSSTTALKPEEGDATPRQEPPPSSHLDSEVHRTKRKEDSSMESDDDDEEDNYDGDMFMEPQETEEDVVKADEEDEETEKAKEVVSHPPFRDNHGMSQHFFPSFAPVFSLGHSRPPQLFHQENYYGKSRGPGLGPDYNPFRAYRESSYKVPITIDDDPISSNILGSGNFGVLKGGTYYNDDDRGELGLFSPYYNNGHGRPYSANPRPQKYSNGDFFANFRDFADINTPNKASFSEYVIVYVNKNASKTDEGTQVFPPGKIGTPKNIIEQLSLLDSYPSSAEAEAPAAEKKVSLHKRKLALLHQEKTNKEKKSYFKKKEPLEPLLALS